jgi:hypothetical protein
MRGQVDDETRIVATVIAARFNLILGHQSNPCTPKIPAARS